MVVLRATVLIPQGYGVLSKEPGESQLQGPSPQPVRFMCLLYPLHK